MLSILIPIFRFDAGQFVQDLHRQATAAGVPFEVLCFEDGSGEKWKAINRQAGNLPKVFYRPFSHNQGRSRIRNLLAEQARYPYLLFLDCDGAVVSEDFIINYLNALEEKAVICGGRVYPVQKPAEASLVFHWKYGLRREVQPAAERRKRPYHGFQTNNFLIPKKLSEISFDESLRQYGHEDTLFGQALREAGVPIIHIDNPVMHLGLEPADQFLEKKMQGVENLYQLYRRGIPLDTPFVKLFEKIRKARYRNAVRNIIHLSKPFLKRNLHSARPSLFFYDLLRLARLLELDATEK